jgi:hypothetical protein
MVTVGDDLSVDLGRQDGKVLPDDRRIAEVGHAQHEDEQESAREPWPGHGQRQPREDLPPGRTLALGRFLKFRVLARERATDDDEGRTDETEHLGEQHAAEPIDVRGPGIDQPEPVVEDGLGDEPLTPKQ